MSAPESSVVWSEHSSRALGNRLTEATLVLPIGATEQHGPHLPVGVDAMVAEQIALRSAERVTRDERPVLVAPPLSFGSSHHHLPLAGTLSLTSTTLHAVLVDLLTSAAESGVRRFLILNGHGGNDDVARQAARDVTTARNVVAAAVGYWSLARARLEAIAAAHDISPVPGHAGAFESSLVLALWPHLASSPLPERAAPHAASGRTVGDVVIEQHGWIQSLDGGFTDSPANARADAGREMLELLVASCAELLTDLSRTTVTHG